MGLFEIFTNILNMSITVSPVILVVLLVRKMLWRLPKKYAFLLWIIVGIRLICPVFLTSPVSLFHLEPLKIGAFVAESNSGIVFESEKMIVSGENGYSEETVSENNDISEQKIKAEKKSENYFSGQRNENSHSTTRKMIAVHIAAAIWIFGIGIIWFWNLCLIIRLKKKLSTAVLYQKNIYESDQIVSPFIMGFVRPKIYIPFRLSMEEQKYILKHEQYHIARKDYITKLVAFMITTIYWFHPLVWAAYFCMSSDMEMSCDEYVISSLGQNIKKEYSKSLLAFATNKRRISTNILAFGETNTRRRVKNIMHFKKKGKYVGIIGILVILVVAVVCLTDNKTADKQNSPAENTSENSEENSLNVVKEGEEIIFSSDVTGDGIKDKIVVDSNATDVNTSGEGAEVIRVISGSTGETIYRIDNREISTVHPGFRSLYLYHGEQQDYLMIWNPEMYQGIANYQWKIVALNEQGKENVLEQDEFAFDLNNPAQSDAENLKQFINKLNEKLADSDIIISTLDGELVVNDSGNQKVQKYDVSDELEIFAN